jgi:hypothetical protein
LNIKTLSRAHRAARMSIMGFKDDRIAQAIGLTPAGLAQLKQRPEYKNIEQEVLQGEINTFDEALAGDIKALRNEFAVGVPLAMRALVENVMQKKDLKTQLEAAKELLDRDPNRTFSKENQPQAGNGPVLPQSVIDNLAEEADKVAAEINSKVVIN